MKQDKRTKKQLLDEIFRLQKENLGLKSDIINLSKLYEDENTCRKLTAGK